MEVQSGLGHAKGSRCFDWGGGRGCGFLRLSSRGWRGPGLFGVTFGCDDIVGMLYRNLCYRCSMACRDEETFKLQVSSTTGLANGGGE